MPASDGGGARTYRPGAIATNVGVMADRSRKAAKPVAAFGVLATMASIWWFALRPRRKDRHAAPPSNGAEGGGPTEATS
ncbi:MAG: hypothetical protein ACYCVN_07050 [Acidimicrobiales bacterium]